MLTGISSDHDCLQSGRECFHGFLLFGAATWVDTTARFLRNTQIGSKFLLLSINHAAWV